MEIRTRKHWPWQALVGRKRVELKYTGGAQALMDFCMTEVMLNSDKWHKIFGLLCLHYSESFGLCRRLMPQIL